MKRKYEVERKVQELYPPNGAHSRKVFGGYEWFYYTYPYQGQAKEVIVAKWYRYRGGYGVVSVPRS